MVYVVGLLCSVYFMDGWVWMLGWMVSSLWNSWVELLETVFFIG